MNTFELSLDLDKSVGAKQWVTLRQGDKRGTTLQATLYDHGVLVSGSYTCRVSIRHPNRNTYYRETATYSNGVATVTIDETSAASVVGVTEGYFELLQGSAVIASTESFGVRVLQSATDGATVGPPYDSAIEDALDELDAATGRISQMVVDATAEYLAAHPEITTTVQDNSVTDAKLIQSGGVLDRVGRLWWRLENLLTNTPAESESVTVADAAKTPVAGLTVYGKSTQDGTPTPDAPVAIQSVTPNLLRSDMSTHTTSGVTFTVGADGSIAMSGTATGQVNQDVGRNLTTLPAGVYTCGAGTGSGYSIVVFGTIGGTVTVLRNGFGTFRLNAETPVFMRIVIASGAVVSGTVSPCIYMMRSLATYVPYGSVGLWSHSRNLLRNDVTSRTVAGVKYEVAADGTITLSGTASAAANQDIGRDKTMLPAGSYICGSGTGTGYSVTMFKVVDGAATVIRSGFGTFTLDTDTSVFMRIVIASGAAVNATIRPYICAGSTAQPYVPYASSTTAIPLDGHVLRSLPDGTRDEVTVDQYGHAILTQRVGSTHITTTTGNTTSGTTTIGTVALPDGIDNATPVEVTCRCDKLEMYQTTNDAFAQRQNVVKVSRLSSGNTTMRAFILFDGGTQTASDINSRLAEIGGIDLLYPLATPVTHDLGTIDPTALVGPDMTAQAVPTAPFALTYERDLNATLARLEAAIAEVATS